MFGTFGIWGCVMKINFRSFYLLCDASMEECGAAVDVDLNVDIGHRPPRVVEVQPAPVVERVWIPDRVVQKTESVLVEPTRYEKRVENVLVEPAHIEKQQLRVLVAPAGVQKKVRKRKWLLRSIPRIPSGSGFRQRHPERGSVRLSFAAQQTTATGRT